MAYTTGDTVATTNTSASETTQGWDASLSLGGGTTNQPGVIKKTGSVSVSAGIITSDSQKQQNTAGNKYTNTATLSGGGQYDDYVYYQQEEIYVYRYPILYPIDSARGEKQTKSDDVFGTSGDITYAPTDQFLQIMVPQEPQNWGNGSVAEWYNPIHQIYNIFTCSFVKTSGVKAELYWTDEWKAENDLSTEDKVGESTAYSLPGWSRTGASNMKEFVIGWKASDKLSKVKSASDGLLTGYLHVKLVAEDSELHTDNNWGYVRVGLYDPDIYEGTSAGVKSMSAKSGAKTSASKASPSQPPITAEYVKKSAKIITENGKKYVQAKVRLTSSVALPGVKIAIVSTQYNGKKVLVAGRCLGGIHAGADKEVTLKAPLNLTLASRCKSVEAVVLSPWLKPEIHKEDAGGCSAGFGALALLATLTLPAMSRKRKG